MFKLILLTLRVTISLGANLVIRREEVKITTTRLPGCAELSSPHIIPFSNRHPAVGSHHQPVIPILLAVTVACPDNK